MFNSLKKWYYRFKARHSLINRYEYLHEVDTLLETYLTDKLIRGGSEEFVKTGRENLAKKQAEMRENAAFVDFLKNTK